MCKRGSWIYNRFIQQHIFCKCGKCPSCLSEKGGELSSRIRQHTAVYGCPMFVTLTYDRISCPFVRLEEVVDDSERVKVYRHYTVHRSAITHKFVRKNKKQILTEKFNFKTDNFDATKLPNLRYLRGEIGVLFYDDVKNFLKRFRQYIKRYYGYDGKITYFSCSEYGPTTGRPHFHLLIWYDRTRLSQEAFADCVVKSWPFASPSRTSRYIEVARDCSSYVSSYLNSSTCVPDYLSKNFKQQRSASRWFGVDGQKFTPEYLVSCAERASFEEDRVTNNRGDVSSFCVSERVINRYFPYFKGYSRLSPVEAFQLLRCPATITKYAERLGYKKFIAGLDDEKVVDDYKTFMDTVRRSYLRTWSLHHGNDDLFAYYYLKVHRAYKSFQLKFDLRHSEVCGIPIEHQFYNIGEYHYGMHSSLDAVLRGQYPSLLDPNEFPHIVKSSDLQEKYFHLRVKQSKVTNHYMSEHNHYI